MAEYYKDPHIYDDIIQLPNHRSKTRPHMSLYDRAAQFAPFKALSGHEEELEETARLTETKIVLDDSAIEKLNEKLYEISQRLDEPKTYSVTYFKPDLLKSGGAYLTDIGCIKKLNTIDKCIMMDSGISIPMEHIISVEENK